MHFLGLQHFPKYAGEGICIGDVKYFGDGSPLEGTPANGIFHRGFQDFFRFTDEVVVTVFFDFFLVGVDLEIAVFYPGRAVAEKPGLRLGHGLKNHARMGQVTGKGLPFIAD